MWAFGGATLQNLQNGTGAIATHGRGRTMAQAITFAQPDVMLLEAGINNIFPGATGASTAVNNALRMLVQTIINTKPDVQVVVAINTPYSVTRLN